MKNSQFLVGALAGATGVGIVILGIWFYSGAAKEEAPLRNAPLSMRSQTPASQAAIPPPADPGNGTSMPTPPWLNQQAGAGAAASPEKAKAMQEIRARLAAANANGHPDPKAIDAILADTIRVQGSSVINGIDFNVLRNNMAKAQEIQTLAKEMQDLAKQPKPDTTRIQALLAQIQKAQAGVRTDIVATPGKTGDGLKR